jgi:F420-0:gamma-glutamyl ligase
LETSSWKDLYWNESSPTISKIDEIAAWASILMGQWDERIPVVQVKGVKYTRNTNSSIKEAICQ